MTMTQIFRYGVLALLAVLAGCNAGEDFSDGTTVSGGIISQDPADPLDPLQDAVEIELVAGVQTAGGVKTAVVTNIGYRCGDVDFYVPVAEPGEVGNTRNLPQHIARCPLDATEVQFFVGRRPADGGKRFYIGSARIPQCNGRDPAECSNGEGFYQFAVSDLVNSPERSLSSEVSVSARLAALAVLDSNNSINGGDASDDLLIEIPNEAHDVTSAQFDAIVPVGSGESLSDYTFVSYAAFTADWDNWRSEIADAVDAAIVGGATMNALPDWPTEADAQQAAGQAGDRVSAGLFVIEHNNPSNPYYATAFDDNLNYLRLSMVVTSLVFPDGDVIGIGPATIIPLNGDGDALDSSGVSRDLAVIKDGAALDEARYLGGAPGATIGIRTLFNYDDDGATDLDMSGRMFGGYMYDGIPFEGRVDYDEEYPVADSEVIYDATETGNEDDLARMAGTLLGDPDFGSPDGLGFRMARSASVAGSLDESFAAALPPFYQLTFYKACVSEDPESPPIEQTACNPIPANEIGEDENGDTANANYNAFLPGGTEYPSGFPVTEEQKREYVSGDGGEVNLQFLADGTIVTDRDADCQAVDGSLHDGDLQEYKVGFITRTITDSTTDNRSVNIVVYLVGDAALADGLSPDYIPQYGTLVQGRMNLGTELAPNPISDLYRLSDANYNEQIRARWLDLYQSRELEETTGQEFEQMNALLQREYLALGGGATEGAGRWPDGMGGCDNLPPP